jgi:CHAT domain-containing protein
MKVDLIAGTIGTVMNADAITIDSSGRVAQHAAPTRIKVLFLSANQRSTTRLAIDEEAREIDHKIRMSEHRDALDVITAWAVRPDDLLQQLNQHRPQIVHLSGHGTSDGAVILTDAQGEPKPVSSAALEALFASMRDNIRVVVLNACYSRVQAEAISQNIDFVIGMSHAIGDQAAIVFAAAFYRALGFGRTVQASFEQARVALLLEGIPEHNTPALLVRHGTSAQAPLYDNQGASG